VPTSPAVPGFPWAHGQRRELRSSLGNPPSHAATGQDSGAHHRAFLTRQIQPHQLSQEIWGRKLVELRGTATGLLYLLFVPKENSP